MHCDVGARTSTSPTGEYLKSPDLPAPTPAIHLLTPSPCIAEQQAAVSAIPVDSADRFGRGVEVTDTKELDDTESVRMVVLDTSPDPRDCLTATVARKTWDLDVIELSLLLTTDCGYAYGHEQQLCVIGVDADSFEQVMGWAVAGVISFFDCVGAAEIQEHVPVTVWDVIAAVGDDEGEHPQHPRSEWQELTDTGTVHTDYWAWVTAALKRPPSSHRTGPVLPDVEPCSTISVIPHPPLSAK